MAERCSTLIYIYNSKKQNEYETAIVLCSFYVDIERDGYNTEDGFQEISLKITTNPKPIESALENLRNACREVGIEIDVLTFKPL